MFNPGILKLEFLGLSSCLFSDETVGSQIKKTVMRRNVYTRSPLKCGWTFETNWLLQQYFKGLRVHMFHLICVEVRQVFAYGNNAVRIRLTTRESNQATTAHRCDVSFLRYFTQRHYATITIHDPNNFRTDEDNHEQKQRSQHIVKNLRLQRVVCVWCR